MKKALSEISAKAITEKTYRPLRFCALARNNLMQNRKAAKESSNLNLDLSEIFIRNTKSPPSDSVFSIRYCYETTNGREILEDGPLIVARASCA